MKNIIRKMRKRKMICKYCGANNNENRRTCKGCGRSLYDEQQSNTVQVNFPADNNQYYSEPEEKPVVKKKNVLMWSIIAASAVFVLAIAVIAIILIKNNTGTQTYSSKIAKAEKYLADNNYAEAIELYNDAIEQDPTNTEAYVKLAELYIKINDYNLALNIAQQGFLTTQNAQLQDMVNKIYELMGDGSGAGNNGAIEVNYTIIQNITSANYNTLVSAYGNGVSSTSTDAVKVNFASNNIDVYYDKTTVDANSGNPKDNSKILYVVLNDPKVLIKNYGGYLSATTLTELFQCSVQVQKVDGRQSAVFEYMDCQISVECDDNGNIVSANPYIKIVPNADNYDSSLNGLKGNAEGTIKDSTGKGMTSVHIAVREGTNMKTGTIVYETDTDKNGKYSLSNLKEGKYTVCVSKKGYTDQYFNVNISKGMTVANQDYTMTGTTDITGDYKMVLEWNGTPGDLDLHVAGMTEARTYVQIYGYGGRNMSVSENGVVIAQLDKNVTDGNGSETVTITGTGITGNYTVHVHDQTNRNDRNATALSNSDAVLKVYIPGESTPRIFNVPKGKTGTCWYPFTIQNLKFTSTPDTITFSTIG